MKNLSLETSKYLLLKERLLADWPSLDEETLGDTLEESPTSMK